MNDRIDLWQGRDMALSFSLKDSSGNPVDLTDGGLVFRAADGLGNAPVFALSSVDPSEILMDAPAGSAVVNVPALATRDLIIPASQSGPFGPGHGPAHLALDWEFLVHWADGRMEQLAQDVLFVNATVNPGQS
ncbi:MAG: hypothetical protein ACPG06_05575 [Alphaproteobacteria bacterium]